MDSGTTNKAARSLNVYLSPIELILLGKSFWPMDICSLRKSCNAKIRMLRLHPIWSVAWKCYESYKVRSNWTTSVFLCLERPNRSWPGSKAFWQGESLIWPGPRISGTLKHWKHVVAREPITCPLGDPLNRLRFWEAAWTLRPNAEQCQPPEANALGVSCHCSP